jgi:single-strand DNA-binding protein
MAEGLNKVLLLGNLGADPELRVTPGGQAILKLRLATTESYLDKNNTRQERTEWHRVTVWGKRGEALAKILTKGSNIFIEGRIQTSTYEKNGEKRYSTDIIANNIILTGRGRGGDAGADAGGARAYSGERGGRPPSSRSPGAPASTGGGGGGAPPADEEEFSGGGGFEGDDDIPF